MLRVEACSAQRFLCTFELYMNWYCFEKYLYLSFCFNALHYL